jgi:hypothetical protein
VSKPLQPEETRFPDKGWDGWLDSHSMIAQDDGQRTAARAAYYGGWMARKPTKLTVLSNLAKWFLGFATLAYYVSQLVGH